MHKVMHSHVFPDPPKKTEKQKKITALAALEQEIGKATYKVTCPSCRRSRVEATVFVYVYMFFLIQNINALAAPGCETGN